MPLPKATALRLRLIGEVLVVHVAPSDEERIRPELPTTTKVVFP
jgi:hypothetical protein